ncbi:MAG: bacillithiol biosynthesis cysteine-adding enzyme BshC, partial [Calditrichaeota bacterium]|nr:bacillithiol biosynthesis cysteine-adding enzyme BshC [Calditrichota bacterium]
AANRDKVADILARQNRAFGMGSRTLENIDALRETDTVAAVTGQQMGYLGGPLFVVYKALTATVLAEQIESATGLRCVPVFYFVSEDHDFEEVRHARILDRNFDLRVLSLPEDRSRVPISARALPQKVLDDLELLSSLLPETEFTGELLELLRQSYTPGATLNQAFGKWAANWLSDLGVVFLDPSDPELKRLALDLFLRELEERSPSSQALEKRNSELEQAGFERQIHTRGGRLNFFYLEGERHTIFDEGERISIPSLERTFSRREFAEHLEAAPEKISPNVVLRPLFQDALVPTAVYVGGPGEIAYYAQLSAVYEAFGGKMAVIWPRPGFTLLEPAVRRYLEKLGVEPTQIWEKGPQLASELAQQALPKELTEALRQLQKALDTHWAEVVRHSTEIDPTLKGYLEGAKGRILKTLNDSEKKIAAAQRRKDEVRSRQVKAVINSVAPFNTPQERVLGVLPFLAKHGRELYSTIRRNIQLDKHVHTFLDL